MVQKRADDEQIAALYRAGQNGPAIAQQLDLGVTTVYRSLARSGIRPADEGRPGDRSHSNRKLSDDEEAQMAREYQGGDSRAILAERYRVNPITVTNALKRLGIERRPRGGAAKQRSEEEALA